MDDAGAAGENDFFDIKIQLLAGAEHLNDGATAIGVAKQIKLLDLLFMNEFFDKFSVVVRSEGLLWFIGAAATRHFETINGGNRR